MNSKQQEKIDKIKEGMIDPVNLSIAKLFFLFWIFFGFTVGGIQFFMTGSWGLGIALTAMGCLQAISFIVEIKNYKVIKQSKQEFKTSIEAFDKLMEQEANKIEEEKENGN